MIDHSSGPWKYPHQGHRTTWNYQAMTTAKWAAQFIALFFVALFTISLIVRVMLGVY